MAPPVGVIRHPPVRRDSIEAWAGTSRSFYLATRPDSTLATIHMPASENRRGLGVLICPPLAWDELCTYRARRTWADSLASAGYPTVRLDLPGVGDSGGSPRSPDRLTAWIEATATAAHWLRESAGCTRIAGIGIGLGGMLAWLAAAQGAPIDDLALWAVPLRGRQLMREQRAAAMLSIDRRTFFDSPAAEPVDAPGIDAELLMDEAGQVMTPETIQAISAVDLGQHELPHPGRRRVLVFERSGHTGDSALVARLRATSVELTATNGDEHGAMMRYVQESVTPQAAIDASLSWLAGAPEGAPEGASEPTAGTLRPTELTSRTMELVQDGVAIRERPIVIDLGSGVVCGILTEPATMPSSGLTAIFFSGGADRRIGPNRLWVDLARRWAAQGMPAVRLDPSGVGDSAGDERFWDHIRAHYDPAHVDRTVEILDALAAHGLPNRFVLTGFCSGAYRSLQTAARDRRVAGVFAISLPFFRWNWWTVNVRDSWLVAWEPRPGDGKAKIVLGRVLQRGLRFVNAAQHRLLAAGQHRRIGVERTLEQLSAQGTELLLIVKRHSYAHELLSAPRRRERLEPVAHLEVALLPSEDARFRPQTVQRWVGLTLDAALDRLRGRETAARFAEPRGGAGDDRGNPADRLWLVPDRD